MDTAFFIASKTIGLAVRFETWIVLGLVVAMWALVRERYRLARWCTGLVMAAVLGLGVFPLGDLLIRPLEERFPIPDLPERVDGIIILGGGEEGHLSRIWGQPITNEAGERFSAAATLARRYPEALVLFTGGSAALATASQTVTDPSDMAARLLTDLGLSPERLRLESASRNTAENARFSHALMSPTPEQNWILVTSAFHMPRAVNSFRAAGWTGIVPYPVDYRTGAFHQDIGWELARHLMTFNIAAKEHVGLLVYRMTGQ